MLNEQHDNTLNVSAIYVLPPAPPWLEQMRGAFCWSSCFLRCSAAFFASSSWQWSRIRADTRGRRRFYTYVQNISQSKRGCRVHATAHLNSNPTSFRSDVSRTGCSRGRRRRAAPVLLASPLALLRRALRGLLPRLLLSLALLLAGGQRSASPGAPRCFCSGGGAQPPQPRSCAARRTIPESEPNPPTGNLPLKVLSKGETKESAREDAGGSKGREVAHPYAAGLPHSGPPSHFGENNPLQNKNWPGSYFAKWAYSGPARADALQTPDFSTSPCLRRSEQSHPPCGRKHTASWSGKRSCLIVHNLPPLIRNPP